MHKRLLVALWYFGNTEGYRAISQRFGIAMSTAHTIVYEVSSHLCDLLPEVCSFPSNYQQTASSFSRFGFPGVIGAIDGSHIRVLPPEGHKADYLNRHNNPSVNLTAVCDANGKMTYINLGYTGKVNDA